MKKEQDNRRSFLKHVLAGTAAVVGTAAIVRSAKAKATPVGLQSDEVLYQETESFRKYYETLRS